MGLVVFSRAWVGQRPLQPFGEGQLISLKMELEASLLPVQLSQIKAKVCRLRGVRHDAFSNDDVIGRGSVGI